MKKLAMILLTAGLAFSSGAVLAADGSTGGSGSNNGLSNQSGGPGSVDRIAPNGVSNSKINTSDTNTAQQTPTHKKTMTHKKTSKNTDHKITMCKDGRCPKQTPGTAQSARTGN
ncbi:protein YbgS [Rouxiella sp. T17]|uniref:protein YbgS n=1 Tax=Rouxiella sp. T17 TaxID=3085684 RepID=UPI002FC82DC6